MPGDDKFMYRGLEVIGAGFGRTGTMSLMKALEILYPQLKCYHMAKVLEERHAKLWLEMIRSGKTRRNFDFRRVFGPKYIACVDFPACTYWYDIHKQYPNAKVVLTVRSSSEKWWQSAYDTILQMMPGCPWKPLGHKLFDNMGLEPTPGWQALHTEGIMQRLSDCGPQSKGNFSKESIISAYEEHIKTVKRVCREEKIPLLVYEVTQGWEPLCKFLELPVPKQPFPSINDTNSFKKYIRVMTILGWVVSLSLLALIAGAVFIHKEWEYCQPFIFSFLNAIATFLTRVTGGQINEL